MAKSEPIPPQSGEALILFSVEGTLLRATSAARWLLRDAPELEAELKRFVRKQRQDQGTDIAGRMQVGRERYFVRSTFIGDELLGAEPSVLLAIERATEHEKEIAELRVRFGFTKRQAEVALLILARRSNIEIAEHFGISCHTARHHVQAVLTKLGVRSRSKARDALAQAKNRNST